MRVFQVAKGIYRILRDSIQGFIEDDCMRLAAALSYYAAFSLPPSLFLLITVLGYFIHPDSVRGEVSRNLIDVVGQENAGVIESLLTAANKVRPGIAGSILGTIVLAVAASAFLSELQADLNKVWQVTPSSQKAGVVPYLLKRLLSFSMLFVVAALLIFSLMFNTAVSAFGEKFDDWFHSEWLSPLLRIIHLSMSFVLISLLFAVSFKILPNASVRWRDVWLGAAATTGLFALGNLAVGFYLAHSSPASAYGAASSLGVLLIWIYYASLIFLFGAEFTRALSQHRDSRKRCELSECRDAARLVEK